MRVTASPKPGQVDQCWYILDLANVETSLGRVATEVARVLMGKHKLVLHLMDVLGYKHV